ncbi:MAG: DUF6370 family protein [Myxococcota bacterium]
MLAFLWLAAAGCGRPEGIAVTDREVTAGCGTCVLHRPESKGCYWAVEIDGVAYPVGGEHPPDDMVTAHEPGGMCAQPRAAVVSGEIRPDGRFLATKFELVPLEGDAAAAPDHAH